jgi:hypothetical protein
MRAILAAMVGILLTGCAHPQPTPLTALPDRHNEDWLVQKAIQYFENQRAAYLTGDSAGFDAAIGGSEDFDRSLPVRTEWFPERNILTVYLPRSKDAWFDIKVDAQTGQVKGSSISFIHY